MTAATATQPSASLGIPGANAQGSANQAGAVPAGIATNFLDLIGLLLSASNVPSSTPTDDVPDTNEVAPGADGARSLQAAATPDQIAATLIRSMSIRSMSTGFLPTGVPGGMPTAATKADPGKVKQDSKQAVGAAGLHQISLTGFIPVVPLILPQLLPQAGSPVPPASGTSGTGAANSGVSATTGVPIALPLFTGVGTEPPSQTSSSSNVPLAFQLILTPEEAHPPAALDAPASAPLGPVPAVPTVTAPDLPAAQLPPLEKDLPSARLIAAFKNEVDKTVPQPEDASEKVLAVAAASSAGDQAQGKSFQSAFDQTATATPSQAGPPPAAAEPQKPLEPPLPAPMIRDAAQIRSAPAQQITVRVSQPEQPNVDLHIAQRAGQVQVAVRTQDPVLQVALREDLGSLVHSLERGGLRTEAVLPGVPTAVSGSSRMSFSREQSDAQRDSGAGGFHSGQHGHGDGQSRDSQARQQGLEAWANALEEQTV